MSDETKTDSVDATVDLDAAAFAILGDPAPAKAEPEEPESDAEPEAEAKPEPTEETPEPAKSKPRREEVEADEKPDEARVNRLFKAARLKQQAADRAEAEVMQARREIEAERAQLAQEREQNKAPSAIMDEFRRDPMAGLVAVSRALGVAPQKMYQVLTERQLAGGAPGATEVADRFAELERKMDARIAEVKQSYEQQFTQAQTASLQKKYRECLAVNHNPEVGKHWPNLYRMPTAQYEAELAGVFDELAQRNPEMLEDTVALLDTLDKSVAERYAEMERRAASLQPAPSAVKDGEAQTGSRGSDSRPSGKPSRASRGKPVTNDDQAEGGRTRALSEKERNLLSDEIARRELGLL